jgi:hypothetical protein
MRISRTIKDQDMSLNYPLIFSITVSFLVISSIFGAG